PVVEHQPIRGIVDETGLDECREELLWVAGPLRCRGDLVRGHVPKPAVRTYVVQAPPPEEVKMADQRCAVDRQTTGGPNGLPVLCQRLVAFDPGHVLPPSWLVRVTPARMGQGILTPPAPL